MTQLKTWLTVLLAFQTCLAAGLFWNTQHQLESQHRSEPVLEFDDPSIDRVVIQGEDKTLNLVRRDDRWLIPEYHSLPADESRIKGLLSRLQDLKVGWPVAVNRSSFERFEVADDNFKRRLQLYQGDQLVGELLVGSSPSLKKSHLRRQGEDEVYTANLQAYDLPNTHEVWLDKGLLQVSEVNSIQGPDYRLEKGDGGWGLVGSDEPLSTAQLNELVSTLKNLRVTKVESISLKPQATLRVNELIFQLMAEDGRYYLRRDDIDQVFSISKASYEKLSQTRLKDLKATPEGEVEEEENE